MDAVEFDSKYSKFLGEIKSVIRLEFLPIVDELESKEPRDIINTDTCFQNENEARGLVWGMFVERANKYAYQTITIDIDDIKSLGEIEMFFILLEKERIAYHPESSFHDVVNTDLNGEITIPSFTFDESERLDLLMGKCRDLVDEMDVSIYEISKRANLIVRGKNGWNQSPPEKDY